MFSGTLFEVDVRLRPGGSAGMLVSSVSGYQKYLATQAWIWEHQALVNARFVLGSEKISQAFTMIREETLCQQREPKALKKAILDMRDKMLTNLASEQDSLKVTMGGMVDVEFIVQYGVLLLAYQHKALTQQYGITSLLNLLQEYKFVTSKQRTTLSNAYDCYQKQQRLLLLKTLENENVTQLQTYQTDVAEIWECLFNDGSHC
jgi:glutamate-ammonia-ligase adenylyltransferase